MTAARLVPVTGDLREPLLGLDTDTIAKLSGTITHFCHFAAIYDINDDEESQMATNTEGTRNALTLAGELKAGRFQHISSIAAVGL